MPSDQTRGRAGAATAPVGEDDDDADDALDGDASGSKPPAAPRAASGTPNAPAGDAGDDDDVDYRTRYLEARRERNRLARRLSEMRTAAEKDKTTPPADLQARIDAAEKEQARLKAELHRERTYTRIMQEATRQGAVDPEVVASLLATSDDLEVDDEGKPKNLPEIVKDLLRTKPYLSAKGAQPARTGDAGAGRGTGNEPGPDFNTAFRRLAAKG